MSRGDIAGYKTPKHKPRTKKAMLEYLKGHPRYDTMNNWNAATSYARGIKVHWLDYPDKATEDVAWDMVGSDTNWWSRAGLRRLVHEFDSRWSHNWQLGTNGRSGGYIVLYQGGTKSSGYQSYCEECGQQNYARVVTLSDSLQDQVLSYVLQNASWTPGIYLTQSEIKAINLPDEEKLALAKQALEMRRTTHQNITLHNQCGRCQAHARVNYDKSPLEVFSYPGRGVDMEKDWDEWDKQQLADRVEVVYDMDRTVDRMIEAFIKYCQKHRVEEQEVLVPTTKRVAVPR